MRVRIQCGKPEEHFPIHAGTDPQRVIGYSPCMRGHLRLWLDDYEVTMWQSLELRYRDGLTSLELVLFPGDLDVDTQVLGSLIVQGVLDVQRTGPLCECGHIPDCHYRGRTEMVPNKPNTVAIIEPGCTALDEKGPRGRCHCHGYQPPAVPSPAEPAAVPSDG